MLRFYIPNMTCCGCAQSVTKALLSVDPKSAIPAKLMLLTNFPRAGQYALWIQFKADGQVRTVPFVITVPTAPN